MEQNSRTTAYETVYKLIAIIRAKGTSIWSCNLKVSKLKFGLQKKKKL